MFRFIEFFEEIEDPRANNSLHDLAEILFIALLATLSGATTCSDMAEFGRVKETLLRSVLSLEYGPPSHDTFSRVFRLIRPKPFEKAFARFMKAFGEGLAKTRGTPNVIAIDGKALKGAYETGLSHSPRMMVEAWGAQTRMVLASVAAPDRDETQAAQELLDLVQLKGAIVTGDALHCNRAMVDKIVENGGDYVLALKGNQSALYPDAVALIDAKGGRMPRAKTQEYGHGRKETRAAVVVPAEALGVKHSFPGLAAVARVVSRRGKDDPLTRYFICSKPYAPDDLIKIVRTHWSIENGLHWILDVVLNEDQARNRKDNGPENLAIIKRLALNVARAHPDQKTPMRRKLRHAGWDEAYLFELLAHVR
jgi:predicted transposase YbfD/YdcC